MASKKSAIDIEWWQFQKKEQKFLASRTEKKDTFLNKKLAEKVPEKLQGTLDSAFAKAFGMIFEKGTGIIEKTFKKDELRKIDDMLIAYIEQNEVPDNYDEKQQIERTAAGLSKELLYMKFLQGIPIVGVVGGAYDVVYLK